MGCVVWVLEDATHDEALAVLRRISDEHTGSFSMSDTEYAFVSVKDPDDEHGKPIFEGSILAMGTELIPGTYFATEFGRVGESRAREYVVEDDGTVWHRMR